MEYLSSKSLWLKSVGFAAVTTVVVNLLMNSTPPTKKTRPTSQHVSVGYEPTSGRRADSTPGHEPTNGHRADSTPGYGPTNGRRADSTPGYEPTNGHQADSTPGHNTHKTSCGFLCIG